MHVTLVGGYDDRFASTGGVRPYVEKLAQYLNRAGIPHLTVVSGAALEVAGHRFAFPVRNPGSTVDFVASLFADLASLPIPRDSVIHVQRPDLLLPFALGRLGKTWVCTIHGNPRQGIRERGGRLAFAGYATLEAKLLRKTHRVIFVDSSNSTDYLRRYPWLGGRIDVIPNAVDTDSFRVSDRAQAREKWGFDGTVFLYAGRLQPEKRVVEIVRAFRELRQPDASLAIAGVGRDKAAVEYESRGLNVRMLGAVPRSEMPSLMNASSALIMFSSREGLPTVALEALASGLPVISTPVGALAEVVIEGKTGFLVTTRTDLVEAMRRIHHGDLVPSQSISVTVDRYSWAKLGPQLLQAYEQAVHAADRTGGT